MLKEKGIRSASSRPWIRRAQDMSAQLAKIKASDSDTIIVTTAVEQLTLIFKQAAALGLKKQIITTGGSQNPRSADRAGRRRRQRHHAPDDVRALVSRTRRPNPEATKYFIGEWKKRGFDFAGATESFRGYDGIRTIAAAIEKAGKAEPEAITAALWKIDVKGLNGEIKFQQAGPGRQGERPEQPNVYLIKIDDGKVVLPKL